MSSFPVRHHHHQRFVNGSLLPCRFHLVVGFLFLLLVTSLGALMVHFRFTRGGGRGLDGSIRPEKPLTYPKNAALNTFPLSPSSSTKHVIVNAPGGGGGGGKRGGVSFSSSRDGYGLEERAPWEPKKLLLPDPPGAICGEWRPDLFVLIYVHSAPSHFHRRALIRRTFGSSALYRRLRAVTVFVVGTAHDDVDLNQAVALEAQRYGDVVQGDFRDSYRNLTLKAIFALRWVALHCPQARHVLKVDDDVFVNVFNLVRHLKAIDQFQEEEEEEEGELGPEVEADVGAPGGRGVGGPRIHCLVWTKMKVIRDRKSKWFVSKEEFEPPLFPPYCSGSAFFMGRSVVRALVAAAPRTPFLWVDDAWATGLLAREAGVKHHSIASIVAIDQGSSKVVKKEETGTGSGPKKEKEEEEEEGSSVRRKLVEGEAVFGHLSGGGKGIDQHALYWKEVLEKEKDTDYGAFFV